MLPSPAALAQGNSPTGPEIVYRMQPGDHPWGIAERYLDGMHNWRRVVRLNGFVDSTRLPPGTPVRIPIDWLQREPVPLTVLTQFDEVEIIAADGSRRAAAPGSVLLTGDRLVTSDIGSATLGVGNGSRVLVLPASELELTDASRPIEVPGAEVSGDPSQLSPVGVQLRLLKGAIEGAVRRLTPAGRFEIDTPAAVAAVRGTSLRVSTDGTAAIAEVTEGKVAVRNRAGQVRLDPDQGTRTQLGRAPEPPSQLLPAPDLSALPHIVRKLPIELPFPLTAGAVGWHTQVFRRSSPILVSDQISRSGQLRARDVSDGQYILRVRAIDPRGIEGQTGELDIIVFTQPPPPLMIEPAPAARVSADQPAFRWTELADASRQRQVRLQVAATSDFAAPLIDESSADAGAARPQTPLPPGNYHWRIASIDPEIGQGPFSDAQEFRRVLPAPDVSTPEVDGDRLPLRWPKQSNAVQYRVQVAKEVDFAAPVVDQTVESAELVLERPEAGTYYVRVQGIAADGEAGAFSKPEKFSVEKPVSPWYFLWLLAPLLLAL
ncbi:MAG: FecR domain-containing protein [Burkholderiales bacterium]